MAGPFFYETLFYHIFTYSPYGILIVSLDLKCLYANPFFCDKTGFSAKELREEPLLGLIHPHDYENLRETITNVSSEKQKVARTDIRFFHKKEKAVAGKVSVSLAKNPDNHKPLYYVLQIADMQEVNQLEEKLKLIENGYRIIIEQSPIPIIIHDGSKILFANHIAANFLGFGSTKNLAGKSLSQFFTSSSIKKVENIIRKLAGGEFTAKNQKMHVQRADGKKVHILMLSTKTVFEGKNSIQTIFEDFSNVTTIEQTMHKNYDRFHRIFIEAGVAITLINASTGRVIDCNPSFESYLGYTKNELKKMSLPQLTHPEHILHDISLLNKLIEGKIPSYQVEKRYITKDGKTVWGLLTVSLLGEKKQEDKNTVIGIIQDITKLKQVEKELQEANKKLTLFSYQDGLTSVFNRRYFNEMIEIEWNRAIRESSPISLIMFDIDFFKRFNDTYGHSMGDICLQEIASAAKSMIKRPGDFIARYGGEEFAIILPNTPEHGAKKVAEDIRKAIEKLKIPHIDSPISDYVTISAGVATAIPSRNDHYLHFIKHADQALYQAKKKNRNCVQVYSQLKGAVR